MAAPNELDGPVISIVEVSSEATLVDSTSQSSSPGSLLGNPLARGGPAGRRRSAAIRAATKEDADREPLLIKANREEHFECVETESMRLCVSNLQGWRKSNEDAHAAVAQFVLRRQSEMRAPGLAQSGRHSPPPEPLSQSPSAVPSLAASTTASPLSSKAQSPDHKHAAPAFSLECLDGSPILALLGVFDGHNGRGAADFAATRLAIILSDAFRELPEGAGTNAERQAITTSFQRCDDEMREEGNVGESGCTAACILVLSQRIYLCSAGDCRLAAMGTNGEIVAKIDQDHTPSKNASECDRIAALGVALTNGRVDGRLGVTRAFGDFSFKPFGKPVDQHAVICHPAIVCIEPDCGPIDAVVVGCDGAWELSDLVEVTKSIAKAEDTYAAVTHAVFASCASNRPLNQLTMALSGGSDNITVGCVKFNPRRELD
jgi:serine/threonine protein phosphatase PrpC